MKKFKLEICPWGELMGSVAEDDGAFVSALRVNQSEFENPDENIIPEAFRFAVELLKSNFDGVAH